MLFPTKIRFPLEIRLRFLTFLPKSWCSRSSPRITSLFSNFVPKERCFLLRSEIKVSAQKFRSYAKHDLHALTARHCFMVTPKSVSLPRFSCCSLLYILLLYSVFDLVSFSCLFKFSEFYHVNLVITFATRDF